MATSDQSARDLDYQIQLRLLSQHNKKSARASAATASLEDEHLKGRVGNMFVYGEPACERCLEKMRVADATLWTNLQAKIHVPAPEAHKTGPGLVQCLCGEFCVLERIIQQHYAENPIDPVELQGLIQRVKQVGMHAQCQAKLLQAMTKPTPTANEPHES